MEQGLELRAYTHRELFLGLCGTVKRVCVCVCVCVCVGACLSVCVCVCERESICSTCVMQAPVKATMTATTLTVSWNCRNLEMLSYTFLPHMTAFTMLLKLSSV